MTDRRLEPFGPEEASLAARVRSYADHALIPIDAATIAHEVAVRHSRPMRAIPGTKLGGNRILWLLLAGLLAVALAGALLLAAGALRAPQRLAFVRGGDLYVASADGTGETRIARGNADAKGGAFDAVSWAPDGLHLAVVVEGSSGSPPKVEVLTADGRSVDTFNIALTSGRSAVTAWAPDSRRLAVLVGDGMSSVELFVIGLDGHTQGGIALPAGLRSYIPAIDWSPDGRQLAINGCVCSNAKVPGLWIVAADGSGSRELTSSTEGSVWDPRWSPDGRRIAFSLQSATCVICAEELWVVSVDGDSVLRLSGLEGVERSMAWSPDGQRIAVTTHQVAARGVSGLFVLPADGSAAPIKLVYGETEDALGGSASGTNGVVSGEDFSFGAHGLRWSSDGRRLIYRSAKSDEFPSGSIREIPATGGESHLLVTNVESFDLGNTP